MRVCDPFAGTERELDACRQLDPVGDYLIVESLVPGKWYSLFARTMRPVLVENLAPEIKVIVQRRIDSESDAYAVPLDELRVIDGDDVELIQEGIFDQHILKAVFVLGSGGSGKGTVSDAMFAGRGLKVINADTHFERFLRAAKVPLNKAGVEYGAFNKARELKDKELRHYANRRLGIIVDMTGWAYDKVVQPVKRLRDLGYDLSAVFVTTSLETAMKRNKDRGDAGGRQVPDSFIRDAHVGAHENLARYVALFGRKNFFLIDNDKDYEPQQWEKVVGTKARRAARMILDRPLKNPKGLAWIEKQKNPETADYNDPKAPKDWPEPEPVLPKKFMDPHPARLKDKYPTLVNPKKVPAPKLAQEPKMGLQPDGTFLWPKAPPPRSKIK